MCFGCIYRTGLYYKNRKLPSLFLRTRAKSRVTTLFHRQLTLPASLGTAYPDSVNGCRPPQSTGAYHPFGAELRDVFGKEFCARLSSAGCFLCVPSVLTCSLHGFAIQYSWFAFFCQGKNGLSCRVFLHPVIDIFRYPLYNRRNCILHRLPHF